jgi:DNA repair exonuclease SbcCD ATPase subunit
MANEVGSAVHVVEYSALEAAIRERDEARAALNHPTSERMGHLMRERDEARADVQKWERGYRGQLDAERARSAKLVDAIRAASKGFEYHYCNDGEPCPLCNAKESADKALAEYEKGSRGEGV